MTTNPRDAQALVRAGELARIDRHIVRMWAIHRRWTTKGETTKGVDPTEVLQAIDDLLDQRHKLANPHGELLASADRADTTEWGGCGFQDQGPTDATPA